MHKILLIIILASLIINGCKNQKAPESNEQERQKEHNISKIGSTVEEILKTFDRIEHYDNINEIIGVRDFKNRTREQRLDFNASCINEYILAGDGLTVEIRYMINGKNLMYGEIVSIDSVFHNLVTDIIFYRNDELLNSYIKSHYEFYGKRYSKSKLIDEIFHDRKELRIACGNGGNSYGEREIKLLKSTERNDIEYTEEMLSSILPEYQVLGLIGIKKLAEREVQLPVRMNKLESHILDKNSLISACITCTSGFYTTEEYLMKYNWDKVPNIDLSEK